MRKTPNHQFLYCFKQGHFYYGIIICMGAPTVVKTERLSRASLYPFKEVETIKSHLQSQKIEAAPVPYDSEKPIYNRRVELLNKTPQYARR